MQDGVRKEWPDRLNLGTQRLGCFVTRPVPEAHQREGYGRHQFEPLVCLHPCREVLCPRDIGPQPGSDPRGSIVAKHEPQFQRAEPAPEGDMPVAVVDDLTAFRGLVSQVLGQDREGVDEGRPICHEEQ